MTQVSIILNWSLSGWSKYWIISYLISVSFSFDAGHTLDIWSVGDDYLETYIPQIQV